MRLLRHPEIRRTGRDRFPPLPLYITLPVVRTSVTARTRPVGDGGYRSYLHACIRSLTLVAQTDVRSRQHCKTLRRTARRAQMLSEPPRTALGRSNPERIGWAARRSPHILDPYGRGACDACPGLTSLKVVGTGCVRFTNSPITRGLV